MINIKIFKITPELLGDLLTMGISIEYLSFIFEKSPETLMIILDKQVPMSILVSKNKGGKKS